MLTRAIKVRGKLRTPASLNLKSVDRADNTVTLLNAGFKGVTLIERDRVCEESASARLATTGSIAAPGSSRSITELMSSDQMLRAGRRNPTRKNRRPSRNTCSLPQQATGQRPAG